MRSPAVPRSALSLAVLALVLLLGSGCTHTTGPRGAGAEDRRTSEGDGASVEVVFLHMNDVYEITPLQNGQVGGLARVATLRKRLLAENPMTLTTLGGDFLSPSAMGTAVVDGERLAGRQMVAVLNAVGVDVTTLGNHEFDVGKDRLVERMGESEFAWVVGNVTWDDGTALPEVERAKIVTLRDPESGATVRVGLIGTVLPTGAPDWLQVTDPFEALLRDARSLDGRVDLIVALTHLELEDDERLAALESPIDLILGGHEHENWSLRRGGHLTPVLKADANARTVYVVRVTLAADGAVSFEPELVAIDPSIPDDPETLEVVDRWSELAFDAFRAQGLEPEKVVAELSVPMDGREAAVRNGSNELTRAIADAFLATAAARVEGVQAAIYNSGSIRIDDVMLPGVVTQYDVIRLLPFGGHLVVVDLSGEVLQRILDQGMANRGEGGFLQWSGIRREVDGSWGVATGPLDPLATYRVALTDFLLTGRESGLSFLTLDHPGIELVGDLAEAGEVRRSVIEALERLERP